MSMNYGKFVISLDFELMWGVRDKRTIQDYGNNIKSVHEVIPKLLSLFERFHIQATFSTVGFLFFETKQELIENIPSVKPEYTDINLSPYNDYCESIGTNWETDKYHYAPQLIKQIKAYPEHEVGTHTFSHYYCLEEGQNIESFTEDIRSAVKAASLLGINLKSLVFPRNQYNDDYLEICSDLGIICYRGNEKSWIYAARNGTTESQLRRGFRLLDTYINISGNNCYSDEQIASKSPLNIPSSRFLRPYTKKLKILEKFRLLRIKSGMRYAAKHNLTYHLWWHPHNFGINQNENFLFLEQILKYYTLLKSKYNFTSYTMSQLASNIKNGK